LRAAAIWEKTGNMADPGYASMLGNYGVMLARLERNEEAERLHVRSLEVLRSCCGEQHPDYADRLADHAHILRKLGRKQEAKEISARAASMQQSATQMNSLIVDVEDLRRKR
jgi:tetratricopeptide (TPR) repeat protein